LQAEPMPRRMFRADELTGRRVLVVDDNPSAREILSTMASSFGLDVDVARDGSEALAKAADAEKRHAGYDLVLMDWKMPAGRRRDCETSAADDSRKFPAVIMVTAYGRDGQSDPQRRARRPRVCSDEAVTPRPARAIGEALGAGIAVETRAESRAEISGEAVARLSGARVLLVEDNDLNQELACDLLGRANVQVVVANNGREALDTLAKDSRFDGILMDCQMPVMDGYEATRAIRKQRAFDAMPIIAMTANAMAGDREKVIDAGMVDHIAKPFDVDKMFRPSRSGLSGGARATGRRKQSRQSGRRCAPGVDGNPGWRRP
jgi:CheY-like chemotaxis protein